MCRKRKEVIDLYVPKKWHWVFPPSLVLMGFYIRTQFGAHWDVHALVQLPLVVIAAEWGAYIWQAGVAYQKYVTRDGEPLPEPVVKSVNWHNGEEVEPLPVVTDGLRPLIRVNGQPRIAYSQTTRSVKEDKVRFVAFTLIRQKQNGFPVDLTEKRWVKNWKFSREEFLSDVIDPWKYHGIIARVGERKNAQYDVVRWEVIDLYAQGEKLPPPPR